jgi:DNA end-binding protein Ku
VGVLIAALWALVRELLERSSGAPATGQEGIAQPGSAPPRGPDAGEGNGASSMSKSELYRRAQELDIPGRSKMSKDELARAVAEAKGAPGR